MRANCRGHAHFRDPFVGSPLGLRGVSNSRAKRRGHTHPTKFTEKRARRHAKNIETTQQNLLGKSNSFQAQMASKMQKCPPRKNLLFRQKLSFLPSNLEDTPIFECKKNATPSGARQFPKIHKKNAVGGTPKMLRVSVKCSAGWEIQKC